MVEPERSSNSAITGLRDLRRMESNPAQNCSGDDFSCGGIEEHSHMTSRLVWAGICPVMRRKRSARDVD